MAIRRQATVGMVADTSLYNIDGACVTDSGFVRQVGTAVGVSSVVDGHKVLVAATAQNAYGVLVKSHYESPKGTYGGVVGDIDNYQVANVMTHGRIWMLANPAVVPVFGGQVFLGSDGSVAASGIATNWTFAGGSQPADSVSGEPALVEVQITQRTGPYVANTP
ncbi:MAG: hypothetical protein HUJ97_00070 [Bacteroidales bacterium]|nr:hypothetical protein [Bacteroidales bacterium]